MAAKKAKAAKAHTQRPQPDPADEHLRLLRNLTNDASELLLAERRRQDAEKGK